MGEIIMGLLWRYSLPTTWTEGTSKLAICLYVSNTH